MTTTAAQQRSKPDIAPDRFERLGKKIGFHRFIKVRKIHLLASGNGLKKIHSPIKN
jgi:hypothetical protein